MKRSPAPREGSHARRRISFPGHGLRLAVVADTHSHPHPDALSRIAALSPDHILHGGDIGALSVLDDLAEVAPVLAVRGNIDAPAPGLADSMTIELCDGDRALLTLLLVHIAVYGPKLRADVRRLAEREGADVVVCGHSHVPFAGRDRGLTLFNPGSIGPRRFRLPIVFGVLDISRERVDVRHVDCETGQPWQP